MNAKLKKILLLTAALILPVLFLCGVRLALRDGQEAAEDTYWHIAQARKPFREMLSKKYPVTMSVWRSHFADKELIFHFCMKAYVSVKGALNSKLASPFHGALPGLLLFLFAMYVFCGRRLGLPPGMIAALSCLTAVLTPAFGYRLLMIRPHVLSIGLMLLSYGVLSRGPGKWKTAGFMFLMGMLYAWSYSTPHVIWVAAFFFGAAWFREEGFRSFLSFAAVVLGVPAGFLLHPQFPNTFLIWKVQGVDALLAPVNGAINVLPYASELQTPQFVWLLYALPAFAMLYFLLMFAIRSAEMRQFLQLRSNTRALLYTSLFWMVAMTVISVRPSEYGIPTLTLAFGMLCREVSEKKLFRFMEKRSGTCILLGIFLVFGTAFSTHVLTDALKRHKSDTGNDLTEALAKLAKPGERVVNINWGEFPELSFYAPQFEYTWGMEPMFSYAADRKRTVLLSYCARMDRKIPAWVIGRAFRARYAVLGKSPGIGKYLEENCGWPVVYRNGDSRIFLLTRPRFNGNSYRR